MPLVDMNPKDKVADLLKGTQRGNSLQGYPLELTIEARSKMAPTGANYSNVCIGVLM